MAPLRHARCLAAVTGGDVEENLQLCGENYEAACDTGAAETDTLVSARLAAITSPSDTRVTRRRSLILVGLGVAVGLLALAAVVAQMGPTRRECLEGGTNGKHPACALKLRAQSLFEKEKAQSKDAEASEEACQERGHVKDHGEARRDHGGH